jgi:IS5 family transposase
MWAAKRLKVATGTLVDATIINAPSSTKNADKARDPEMHQTKKAKANQWSFGMKGHFGVDRRSKLIHAVRATPAHVADSTVLPQSVARQRNPRVGRPGVSRPAGGDQGACAQGAGFHQSPLPSPWCCR